VAFLAVCVTPTLPTFGDGLATPPVVRVEEDWKLVLNEPGEEVDAPQLHTVMSPVGDTNTQFARLTLNYWEEPQFEPGGLQVQTFKGDELRSCKSFGNKKLSTKAETITWTQVLEKSGQGLTYTVVNGQSTSWGPFGGPALQLQMPVNVPDLSAYSSNVSAGKTKITYGGNRVMRLVLKEVRFYSADGALVSAESSPRVVFIGGGQQ
jgi:hypothetical protein